jgi:hypothetical protein
VCENAIRNGLPVLVEDIAEELVRAALQLRKARPPR